MVGYVFLARNALEPLSCTTTLDGTKYIKAGAATDIQCSWCPTEADKSRIMSYRSLATWAIVFYTIYGLGTPLLFSIILISNRSRLHTNRFMVRLRLPPILKRVTTARPSFPCRPKHSITIQLHVANLNTIVLLHAPLILLGVWIEMKRGPQQITSKIVGCGLS